ncbi:MAG: hypothetical protein ACOC33_01270 [bacterium]
MENKFKYNNAELIAAQSGIIEQLKEQIKILNIRIDHDQNIINQYYKTTQDAIRQINDRDELINKLITENNKIKNITDELFESINLNGEIRKN